jgi:hypothetical protein
MRSILDPSFRYTPSFATDLKRTFARIRRQDKQNYARILDAPRNVASIVAIRATGTPRVAKSSLWRPR